MHAGEPRRKRGIELLKAYFAYVTVMCVLRWPISCRCCLQESSYAQQCCCAHRLTMIWVQQYRQRQQRWEADWCRHKWGCVYMYVGQPLVAASRNHPLFCIPTPLLPRDHAHVPLYIAFLSVTDKTEIQTPHCTIYLPHFSLGNNTDGNKLVV